jgi:hypothetical protein
MQDNSNDLWRCKALAYVDKWRSVLRALAHGGNVHLVVCVHPDATSEQNCEQAACLLKVKTSRHGKSKWTNVPLAIPDGEYSAVLTPMHRRR